MAGGVVVRDYIVLLANLDARRCLPYLALPFRCRGLASAACCVIRDAGTIILNVWYLVYKLHQHIWDLPALFGTVLV